jgi:hypothetical protein
MPPAVAGGMLATMVASTAKPTASAPVAGTPAAQQAAASIGRGRRFLVWTLVVLASVIALVSILTTWVNRQMLDNTAWNKATTQIVEDPKVQTALATFAVDQLYQNVDVAKALEQRLPSNLKPLASPVAGALAQPATQAVAALLQRPRVERLFIQASSIAQEKLVNVLENKTGHGISTGNGVVTLDLHQLLVEVATELGLPSDAVAKLPQKVGTVTLMRSDQLSAAQAGVNAVRVASTWLLVAVLFLYGLAIYLARGIRRATLRNAGLGLALVGLVTLVLRQLLGNYIVDSLASPGYEPATHRLWLIGTAILGQIGVAAIIYGGVATLGAVFAGPTAAATRLRRSVAPVLNERQGIVWSVVGFVYLLAILWGGTHALRVWWGILLLGGLLAIGVVALRRQTLHEFPPEEAPGRVALRESVPAAAPAPGGAAAGEAAAQRSPAAEIARLKELHDAGTLTDDEFERAKRIALT